MRVPIPAAVAASVDLAAATVGERVTGVINAVLRRVSERSRDAWFDELSQGLDDRDRLALRTAHPRWIVDAYADLLEPSELEQALAANNRAPDISLAIRPASPRCQICCRPEHTQVIFRRSVLVGEAIPPTSN